MDWKKPQTIIGTVVSSCGLIAIIFTGYNHFAKQAAFDALASEVKNEYVREDDLVAMNKNVQQTNYEFWIYRTKQEINELYKEMRATTDHVKIQQIKDQIDQKKEDLKDYLHKLHDLR
jgi:hypothetical protein